MVYLNLDGFEVRQMLVLLERFVCFITNKNGVGTLGFGTYVGTSCVSTCTVWMCGVF